MKLTMSAEERAQALLDRMRQTPMRRGALSKRAQLVRAALATVIAGEGVSRELAKRVSFQLVFKFHPSEVNDREAWEVIGRTLRDEVARLRERVGLADRKIVTVLPKLSAAQLEEFLEELTRADRRIARTILNAAVDGADPVVAGRRYLAEYRLVAHRLRSINPAMARTMANATFAAGMPLEKAMGHLARLTSLLAKHEDSPKMARAVARAGFRT
jgi:hypothetical protein